MVLYYVITNKQTLLLLFFFVSYSLENQPKLKETARYQIKKPVFSGNRKFSMDEKKKKIKIIAKKKKRLKEGDFVYVFVSNTHTPQKKKKKFSSRPQETKKTTNLYTRVSRCTTIDILWSVGGKKKTETETERKKSNIPSQLGKSIDLPLVLKNFSLHITKKNGPLFLKIDIK